MASRESAAVNQMAKAVPEDTLAKGPAGASAAAPTVNLADNSQVKIEPDATPSSEAQSADESRRLGEVHLSPALPSRVMKGFVDKDRAVGQPAPAVAPAAGAVAKTEADKTTGAPTSAARAQVSGGTGVTQQFSQQTTGQAFRNNSQMNRTANVLNSFQVQQEGSEIRVVDSDGSTYTGKIEQLAANAKRAIAKEKPSYDAHVRDVESSAAQSYFRATGFNVSLKKTLVFEGNYVAAPVQQSGARNEAAPAKQKQEPARIVGTAKVKGESPVEVDATAVGPEAR